MPAISCVGLSRNFGDVNALSDLTLDIEPGVVFGFLGRNGAGKTTTIRLFTGLARPTAGETWVNGVKTSDGNSANRRHFGYLPEEPAFYGWMNAYEYLNYIGKLYGLDADSRDSRIRELLEYSGLADDSKRSIGGYSRGMRQRLGLAQALIHRPPILFLDEPTSALDPSGRRNVLELINSLRGKVTIFLSSHILDDIERVCDQIGVIEKGRLLVVAGNEELINRYATNIIALEFDKDSETELASFTQELNRIRWVDSFTKDSNLVRLSVNDVSVAKQELLKTIASSGLLLNRYEWVKPSLEEIFFRISN